MDRLIVKKLKESTSKRQTPEGVVKVTTYSLEAINYDTNDKLKISSESPLDEFSLKDEVEVIVSKKQKKITGSEK